MAKISIITPVYNGEKYLRQAMDSVISQSLEDWELIVVDDGSSDGTPEILSEYTDPRIIKLHQVNSGEAAARNTGLYHARGEYIAFLDADDIFLPNRLFLLSEFLDQHTDFGVVFSNGYISDENGNTLCSLSDIRPGIFTGNILEPLILDPTVISVPVNTMARRLIINENNIRFDTELTYGTDWDFWIHLARITKFGYLDKLTCIYRVHGSNMTKSASRSGRKEELAKDRLKILETSWFEELSVSTRQKFFFILLMDLLEGNPDRQLSILQGERFQDLPDPVKATLWRQVGVNLLLNGAKTDLISYCLSESNKSYPRELKTRSLLLMWKINKHMTRSGIFVWRNLRYLLISLTNGWRKKPKPVPRALGPADG
jgi:glycosyltransferase involved in cell wall biosynthesis